MERSSQRIIMAKLSPVPLSKMLSIESSLTHEQSFQDFKQVYECYAPYVRKSLFWLVPPSAIDDLCQDVFVKVWNAKDKFRNEASVKTWIYRITVNTAYDYLRRFKPSEEQFEDNIVSENNLDSSDIFLKQKVYDCIHSLSVKHKPVFILYYKQELSIEEISAILKISAGTVKSRLHHARLQFMNNLKRHGVNYDF